MIESGRMKILLILIITIILSLVGTMAFSSGDNIPAALSLTVEESESPATSLSLNLHDSTILQSSFLFLRSRPFLYDDPTLAGELRPPTIVN